MLILLSLLAFIAMLCSFFLFLPLTYSLSADIQSPFHIRTVLSFLNHGLYYEWDYVFGQKPTKLCYIGWHKEPLSGRGQPPGIVPDKKDPEEPDKEEEDPLSENTIRDALQGADSPEPDDVCAASDTFWWKDYVWSEDFLSSCLSFFLRLLHHNRIRTVQTTGTLGLSQPHQTGMLSGFLYMLLPQAAQNLQFDFLNEIYDCHIQIAGRIYPGVIVLYALSFIVSPPVRRLLWAVRQHRKEFAHG